MQPFDGTRASQTMPKRDASSVKASCLSSEEVSGFIAYYWIDAGEGTMASLSVFEDKAGADESVTVAHQWVEDPLLRSSQSRRELPRDRRWRATRSSKDRNWARNPRNRGSRNVPRTNRVPNGRPGCRCASVKAKLRACAPRDSTETWDQESEAGKSRASDNVRDLHPSLACSMTSSDRDLMSKEPGGRVGGEVGDRRSGVPGCGEAGAPGRSATAGRRPVSFSDLPHFRPVGCGTPAGEPLQYPDVHIDVRINREARTVSSKDRGRTNRRTRRGIKLFVARTPFRWLNLATLRTGVPPRGHEGVGGRWPEVAADLSASKKCRLPRRRRTVSVRARARAHDDCLRPHIRRPPKLHRPGPIDPMALQHRAPASLSFLEMPTVTRPVPRARSPPGSQVTYRSTSSSGLAPALAAHGRGGSGEWCDVGRVEVDGLLTSRWSAIL